MLGNCRGGQNNNSGRVSIICLPFSGWQMSSAGHKKARGLTVCPRADSGAWWSRWPGCPRCRWRGSRCCPCPRPRPPPWTVAAPGASNIQNKAGATDNTHRHGKDDGDQDEGEDAAEANHQHAREVGLEKRKVDNKKLKEFRRLPDERPSYVVSHDSRKTWTVRPRANNILDGQNGPQFMWAK